MSTEKRRIRVLNFPIANSKGGITQYALRNWNEIDKTKIQFDFATMSKSLDFEEELIKEGCKVFHISCYAEADRELFKREFRKILLEGSYDVVHLHTKQWKSLEVEKIAKEIGIPRIIVHAHSSGIDASDETKNEKEMLLHDSVRNILDETIATDFWACSKKAAEWLYGDRIKKDKIKIIPNAIDTQRFCYQPVLRRQIRQELGIDHKFVLGHVGRLEYVKNHTFLLEILADTLRINPNVVLLLVGEGKMREAIGEKSRELGIMDNVIMIGKSDVPEKYLQGMDVFVFPSLFEGFPLSVIEAQSTGLKCLCSNSVTNEVAVTDNVEFLPLSDRKAWVERILNLIEGYIRKNRSELVKAKGYDLHEQIRQLEEDYLKVDNQRRKW